MSKELDQYIENSTQSVLDLLHEKLTGDYVKEDAKKYNSIVKLCTDILYVLHPPRNESYDADNP